MGGSKTPTIPKAPNAAKTYKQGLKVYLDALPTLLQKEQDARGTYDPQRIAEQQKLQTDFGPTQYQQQLDALNQLDPQGEAIRKQQAGMISSDLESGYDIPDALKRNVLNQFRGSQASRGNSLGNSASAAETLYTGQAAINDYQRRLGNAGAFESQATPEQRLLSVQGVSPDRSSAYVNPNAGYAGQQFGLSNYQNLLAAQAASGGSQNPWMGALQGAGAGASMGSIGGVYGMAGGAIIGGVAGGLGYPQFSDERFKTNIVRVGSKGKIPIYEFSYHNKPGLYRGVMAADILKLVPHAVKKLSGFMSDLLTVDYEALGMRMEVV